MAHVGFLGIGTMGLPMARHLVAAGHAVVAYDPDASRLALLGAGAAGSAAEASREAEVVIASLPSVAAVEQALFGPGGACEGIPRGATVIDMSTSPPALARQLASAFAEHGVDVLDAPVSGGPTGAEAGTLAIMVGGEAEVFARWQPLLAALGGRVEHVGGHGAGQAVKLVNNLIVACTMAGMAEACAILEREGVDPAQAYEVFTRSTSDSSVMRRRFPLPGVRPEHPASRDYEQMFRLDLIAKDVGLALGLADAHGLAAATGRAAQGLYERALEDGLGALDYSAVYLRAARERTAVSDAGSPDG